MEKDIDYERKIVLMIKELKDKKDIMQYLHIILRDVYDEQRAKKSK